MNIRYVKSSLLILPVLALVSGCGGYDKKPVKDAASLRANATTNVSPQAREVPVVNEKVVYRDKPVVQEKVVYRDKPVIQTEYKDVVRYKDRYVLTAENIKIFTDGKTVKTLNESEKFTFKVTVGVPSVPDAQIKLSQTGLPADATIQPTSDKNVYEIAWTPRPGTVPIDTFGIPVAVTFTATVTSAPDAQKQLVNLSKTLDVVLNVVRTDSRPAVSTPKPAAPAGVPTVKVAAPAPAAPAAGAAPAPAATPAPANKPVASAPAVMRKAAPAAAKPAVKAEAKPVVKSDAKPAAKADSKPAAKAAPAKPAAKADAKPANKAAAPSTSAPAASGSAPAAAAPATGSTAPATTGATNSKPVAKTPVVNRKAAPASKTGAKPATVNKDAKPAQAAKAGDGKPTGGSESGTQTGDSESNKETKQ